MENSKENGLKITKSTQYELTETMAAYTDLHGTEPDGVPVLMGEVDTNPYPQPRSFLQMITTQKLVFSHSLTEDTKNF